MTRTVDYRWHLRLRMAEAGMFATTELGPLLAERGVVLSREQVYRLVAGTPERLSLRTLAALCDILGCTAAELVEPVIEADQGSRRAATGRRRTEVVPDRLPAGLRPKRARIVPDAPEEQ